MKLCVWGLGISFGIVWALTMLVMGWTSMWGWGTQLVNTMSSVYIGYVPSFGGAIVGAIWGFADGFIGGALIAFFYNLACCKQHS